MPIKGLNQVALPQAKAKRQRLKFNVVSAVRMWAHVSSVSSLCFLLTPRMRKYLACSLSGTLTVTTVLLIVPLGQCLYVFH